MMNSYRKHVRHLVTSFKCDDICSSKIETRSPSSNVYDDLRGMDSSTRSKVPSRSTSTIGYISPRQIDSPQIKRPTVSLILPVPTTTASIEQRTTLDTILSVDNIKRSFSVESIEHENKDLVTNKDHTLVLEEKDQSCLYWTVREIIQLLYIALFACLMAMLVFTLIFYAFDAYWLEQPTVNSSSWWLDYNDTNFTGFDYDMISATQTINYDDEY